jgi:ABC-type sugar transport system substrate-binding protein
MIAKRNLIALVIALLLAVFCSSVEAQQQAKIPKIGWLQISLGFRAVPGRDIFRQELRKLGYIERKNLTIEYRL